MWKMKSRYAPVSSGDTYADIVMINKWLRTDAGKTAVRTPRDLNKVFKLIGVVTSDTMPYASTVSGVVDSIVSIATGGGSSETATFARFRAYVTSGESAIVNYWQDVRHAGRFYSFAVVYVNAVPGGAGVIAVPAYCTILPVCLHHGTASGFVDGDQTKVASALLSSREDYGKPIAVPFRTHPPYIICIGRERVGARPIYPAPTAHKTRVTVGTVTATLRAY
jgi:hypothetical protein